MSKNKRNYNPVIETENNSELQNIEDTPIPVPEKIGKLHDCERLNVRTSPSKNAEVLCIIDETVEIVIDEEKSTKDWYAVKLCREEGTAEGFCMKKYIRIES